MCGIAGFYHKDKDYLREEGYWEKVLSGMNRRQKHRGPDEEGIFLDHHCGLAQVRLSVIDLAAGHQPMQKKIGGREGCIVYNGEIYNTGELKKELMEEGVIFETDSDTEVVLAGILCHGADFVCRINGIFAFALWERSSQCLRIFRDRLGVKPCFYMEKAGEVLFSSEIKGILSVPGIEAVVDQEGLCEIFGLGPARTPGTGVFRGIREILPGCYLEADARGIRSHCYWKLESRRHEDSWENTVEKMHFLVTDAICRQMVSDVPVCTFLSGGVDSSLVTAICSRKLRREGRQLDTYSFDFKDNSRHFQANCFQPSQDRPWVDVVKEYANTDHTYLECRNEELYEDLIPAMEARDLPCMADVEASMLHFCKKVSLRHKVALTGECADEIFGGYPWFHRKECFEAEIFPWSMDMSPRTMLLKEEVKHELQLEEHTKKAYQKSLGEVPLLEGETGMEKRRREISYLNLRWFMQNLLERMDRTSMAAGLEARVPFADHRIVEYAWNIPWEMKCMGGIVKGLLRAAGREELPAEVLYRKKSPYPKTYDPAYENLLKLHMQEVMDMPNAPLHTLIDKNRLEDFMKTPADYGRPFYGQLMAGPQLLGYLLQINAWLERYRIRLV